MGKKASILKEYKNIDEAFGNVYVPEIIRIIKDNQKGRRYVDEEKIVGHFISLKRGHSVTKYAEAMINMERLGVLDKKVVDAPGGGWYHYYRIGSRLPKKARKKLDKFISDYKRLEPLVSPETAKESGRTENKVRKKNGEDFSIDSRKLLSKKTYEEFVEFCREGVTDYIKNCMMGGQFKDFVDNNPEIRKMWEEKLESEPKKIVIDYGSYKSLMKSFLEVSGQDDGDEDIGEADLESIDLDAQLFISQGFFGLTSAYKMKDGELKMTDGKWGDSGISTNLGNNYLEKLYQGFAVRFLLKKMKKKG